MSDICELPNGIELYDDEYLLVGCADGIYRVKIADKSVEKVTDASNAVGTVDGLFFDEDEDILYAVMQNDRIAAVSSDDNWNTLDVLYIFSAGCSNGMPATVTIADNTLYAVCLGLDNGPYEIRFMKGVDSVVTGGNDVYGDDDEDSSDNDGDNIKKKLRIAVVVLALFCVVLGVLVAGAANAMRNMHLARDERINAAKNGSNGVDINPINAQTASDAA